MFSISKLKKAFEAPCFYRFRRNHNNSLPTHSIASNQLGLRICIWVALKFDTLSDKPYFQVNSILSHNNWHSFYWEALVLLKKKGIFITSDSVRALVRFYSYSGQTEKAIESFGRMHEIGCKPDAHMYNTILRDVLREELFVFALALYNTMHKSNVVPNVYTFNMLIDGFCKSGNIKGAREILDEMQKVDIVPTVVSTNSILYGLCKAKNVDEALMLFNVMKEKGFPPNEISFHIMLDGFCKLMRLEEALSFVWLMKRDGFSLNVKCYSSLINAFFRAKRYSEAHAWYTKMFKEGIMPDVVLYTTMMRGLSDEGRVGEAARLLDEMTQIGLTPDAHCYNAIIKGLCNIGLLDRAQSLRLGVSEHNVCTHTILICEMCKRGMVEEAQELFNQMENLGCLPSVVTFNALINGLSKAHKLEEASLLLYKMEIGKRPSLFLSLYQGYGQVYDSASIHKKVEQMCEAGQFSNAYKFVTQLADSGVVPDIITYNTLINAFCNDGNINGAVMLFKDLDKKGLSPDCVTYGTLINGLYMVGRDNDALEIFKRMQKAGPEPSLSVYKVLMTWLCRKSNVSRAFSLYLEYLKSIPRRDNDSINVLEEYLVEGKLEQTIRGLLELDFRARDFKLAPYTILLIGFCQVEKADEALLIFSILDEFNITINATSCVHLIKILCKERRLDDAVKIFLYSLDKGFMLRPVICNHLLVSLLVSQYKKECAVDLIGKMISFGYNLNSQECSRAMSLLRQYQKESKEKLIDSVEQVSLCGSSVNIPI